VSGTLDRLRQGDGRREEGKGKKGTRISMEKHAAVHTTAGETQSRRKRPEEKVDRSMYVGQIMPKGESGLGGNGGGLPRIDTPV